jgi:transcription elongation GreA/GreB family factor
LEPLRSVRTFRELEEQKSVYLRVRAAAVADALENLSDEGDNSAAFEALSETEGSLHSLKAVLLNAQTFASRKDLGREVGQVSQAAVNPGGHACVPG